MKPKAGTETVTKHRKIWSWEGGGQSGGGALISLYAPKAPDSTICTTQRRFKSCSDRRSTAARDERADECAERKHRAAWWEKNSLWNEKQRESPPAVSHEILRRGFNKAACSRPEVRSRRAPHYEHAPMKEKLGGGLRGLALNPPPCRQIWKQIVQHDVISAALWGQTVDKMIPSRLFQENL